MEKLGHLNAGTSVYCDMFDAFVGNHVLLFTMSVMMIIVMVSCYLVCLEWKISLCFAERAY